MLKGLIGTVVSACLAGAVGVGLFFIKHEVKEQEARLSELNAEIQRGQEAIHVLKAEWSYLNDPTRLRQLSERFLGMKVMGPSQIATLNSLPKDAPAVAKAEPKAVPVVAKVEPKAAAKPAAPTKLAAAPVAIKPAPLPPSPRAPMPVPVAAPVQAAAPAPAAPVQTAAPPPPRTIVIQSPALAQSQTQQAPAGEVR